MHKLSNVMSFYEGAQKVIRKKAKNNIVLFTRLENERLDKIRNLYNLPVCDKVISCLSSKNNNHYSCPHFHKCQKHKGKTEYLG